MTKHKYRVRRGLWGTSVLQRLEEINHRNTPSYIGEPYLVWRDVSYREAPRALTTEIED
jgi:hypothetical protein